MRIKNMSLLGGYCLVLQSKYYYSWNRCKAWVEQLNATGILKDSSRVDFKIKFQQVKLKKVSTERKQRGHRHKNAKEQQLITV